MFQTVDTEGSFSPVATQDPDPGEEQKTQPTRILARPFRNTEVTVKTKWVFDCEDYCELVASPQLA